MERYFCRDKKDYCDKELACRGCEFAKGSGVINGVYVEDVLSTLFGDDYNLDRLKELVKADREGRCVVLPVKPRETFYTIDRVSTLCHLGYYFDDYDCQGCEEKFCDGGLSLDVGKKTGYSRSQVLSFIDSGKKIYLSEQEAESALKAMKERGKK